MPSRAADTCCRRSNQILNINTYPRVVDFPLPSKYYHIIADVVNVDATLIGKYRFVEYNFISGGELIECTCIAPMGTMFPHTLIECTSTEYLYTGDSALVIYFKTGDHAGLIKDRQGRIHIEGRPMYLSSSLNVTVDCRSELSVLKRYENAVVEFNGGGYITTPIDEFDIWNTSSHYLTSSGVRLRNGYDRSNIISIDKILRKGVSDLYIVADDCDGYLEARYWSQQKESS